ncbi:MAG: AmmeMemoRadiSam system protein B [Thermoplasmata archaeon]
MIPKHPRPMAVAGSFYPEDAGDLTRQLEACFVDPRGPGELPDRRRSPGRRIRAAVVPHAGLLYSGAIAAHAFRAIAAERPPRSVLLLGVDHGGRGPAAALSSVAWSTPLGPVPTDPDLVDRLDRPPIERDESAHAREHSIEVELPFLQYVLPQPRAVALTVRFGPYPELEEVAAVVRAAVTGGDVLLIASTDLSHYVPEPQARELDRLAIEAILARDPRGLYETVARRQISMCGVAPTTVLLAALAGEPLTARLLRWGHSGEARPMEEVVGYAALLFEGPDDRG